MPYFYFPREENLRPLSNIEVITMQACLGKLDDKKLPWSYEIETYKFRYFEDKGMTLDNGIMGYTRFFSKDILLSPNVVKGLLWTDNQGIPNNEQSISIVVHELTHRNQMKWLGGLLWPFLNMFGVADLTIEKWARENEQCALNDLAKIYREEREG